MYQAPTSPQTIGGVLDNGFKLYRESFAQVFLLAVAASVATAPASYAALYLQEKGMSASALGTIVGAGLLIVLLTVVLANAIIARIDGVARGNAVSVGDALAIGINRLPAMLGSAIIGFVAAALLAFPIGLAMGAGGILAAFSVGSIVVIIGLTVMVWFIFGPYAVVVERLGPLSSYGYSVAIVRGHWWRTAVLLTIIGIILMVAYVVLGVVAGIAVFANPDTLSTGQMPWYFEFVVGPLLSGVAWSLGYALFLSIYYDLKLRHEGGDLAARIAASA